MQRLVLNNWKSFIDFLETSVPGYPDITGSYIAFRGQSNSKWKLEPTLTRIVKDDLLSSEKANYYEYQAQTEFLAQVHLFDQHMTYNSEIHPIAIGIDMQHYSCPTRLLDWTESPFISLYFAVRESLDSDGAVFVWDSRFFRKNMIKINPQYSEFKSTDILDLKDYETVELIMSYKKNERIVRQQAMFTVSNNILKSHDDIIIDASKKVNSESGLLKIEIPKENKLEFLARLKTMNISSQSLFPGLDGLGKAINELLILRKWKKK